MSSETKVIKHINKLPDDVEIIDEEVNPEPKVINKGTGAGGANTNANGLPYEKKTDLSSFYTSSFYTEYVQKKQKETFRTIKFAGFDGELINVNKADLHKYMTKIGEKNTDLQPAGGCKQPDEAYVDTTRKALYIIEKKFQKGTGSVDEKLQTGPFKKTHYGKLFPNYTVHYIYCLADWFKREEYTSLLEYLEENDIPIFWGSDPECKSKIIDFICFQT
jgi:hypothetical protein